MNITCNICGAENTQYAFSKNNYDLYYCNNCKTLITDITEDDYNEMISTFPLHELNENSAARNTIYGNEIRIRRCLPYLYRNFIPTTNFVDYGCGEGQLVDLAKDYFQNAVGVDIVYYKRNKTVYPTLDSLPEFVLPIHCLTMVEVIEHLYNPKQAVTEIYQYLADSAIIYLESSFINPDCIDKNWEYIRPPVHITYLSEYTLYNYIFNDFRNIHKLNDNVYIIVK